MKKEIVARLLKAEHITFDEALELMDLNKNETSLPYYPYYPYYPTYPSYPDHAPTVTYNNTTELLTYTHN